MYYLLFILIWFLYYVTKGLLLANKMAKVFLFIISSGSWVLLLYFSQNFEQATKIIAMVYLIFSGVNYLLFVIGKQPILIKMFSGLSLITQEINIAYFIFKPFLLLFINIFLIIKGQPILWLNETVEISVKSKKEKANIFIHI